MTRHLTAFLSVFYLVSAKRYDGNTVFRIVPEDADALDRSASLHGSLQEIADFWTEPRHVGAPVDFMVEPDHHDHVSRVLRDSGLPVRTHIDDLQKYIEREKATATPRFNYEDFNTLENINTWMVDLEKAHPSLVSIVQVGTSYEGRIINALKIGSTSTTKDVPKNIVWYEGGIHAREWISPATLIYMAKLFVEQYGVDREVTTILDNLDVYILPVYNVDGYKYSWTNDRLWRKTRSAIPGSMCMGVDPNRNWDFKWGGKNARPCSELYEGPSPNSEIEVASVTKFITALGPRVKVFIDFHSHGLQWMLPWAYTRDRPEHYDDQLALAADAVAAIASVNGVIYSVDTIANFYSPVYGSSIDWAYGAAGIKYSFGLELRGDSFIVDKSIIKPSGLETFEAIKRVSLQVI